MLKKRYIDLIFSALIFSSIPVFFVREDPSFFMGLLIAYGSLYILYRFGKVSLLSFNFLTLATFTFFYPVTAELTIYYEYFYGEFEWLAFNHEALLAVAAFIIPYGIAYNALICIGTKSARGFSYNSHSNVAIFLLFSLWFIGLLARIKFDLYYHIGVDSDGSVTGGEIQNLLDKLHVLGLAAIAISLAVYFRNKTKKNLIILLMLLVVSMGLYIPSGSRTLVLAHLPPIIIILVSLYEKQAIKIVLVSFVILSALIVLLGNVRIGEESRSTSFEKAAGVLVHRLGDFRNTGKVIERIPSQYEFRGAAELEKTWQIFVPFYFRKDIKDTLDFNEGANFSQELGIAAGPWTSEPITLIGDLYARFAWIGILLGGMLVGFGMGILDKIMQLLPKETAIIFFYIHSRFVFQLYVASVLVAIVGFVREAIISIVLSLIVAAIIYRKKSGTKSQSKL